MYNGIKTVELKKTLVRGKFLYEAIEDGKVIATRSSNRDYVAALISDSSTKIISGVGRMDLLPGALRNYTPSKIAILKEAKGER